MGVRGWEWDGGKNGQLDDNPPANSTRWLLRSANTQKRQIDIITKPELQTLLKRAEARSPMTPKSFYPTHWKPLFDAVIAYRYPHVLRHTYATQLLWQGQSPVFVKEQLGHRSIRITVDPYGHAIRSSDKSAVDQLDDPDASLRKSDASNDIRGLKLIKGGLA